MTYSRKENIAIAAAFLLLLLIGTAALHAQTPTTNIPTVHSITLTWTPDANATNVYRSQTSGGPYTKLNASPIPAATNQYTDLTAPPGVPSFYVLTAVDTANSWESALSVEVTGTMPKNPDPRKGVTLTTK